MSIPEASQLILQSGALGKDGEIFLLRCNPIKITQMAKDLPAYWPGARNRYPYCIYWIETRRKVV